MNNQDFQHILYMTLKCLCFFPRGLYKELQAIKTYKRIYTLLSSSIKFDWESSDHWLQAFFLVHLAKNWLSTMSLHDKCISMESHTMGIDTPH